jgi:hypothetical protein
VFHLFEKGEKVHLKLLIPKINKSLAGCFIKQMFLAKKLLHMKIQDLPLETEASTAYSIVPTISLWQNTIAF